MTVEMKEGAERRVPERDDAEVAAPALGESGDAAAEAASETAVPEAGGAGGAPPEVERRLREELAATKDRLLRAMADLDNQRKRMDRERQQLRAHYVSAPLREFLTVVDHLDLALSTESSADDLRTGVEAIRRQMTDLLRRFDVEAVESLNAAFDPNVHEAVAREESAEVDRPTVAEELRKGYVMRSTLLRAAMVRVAMPASGGAPQGARDQAGTDGIEPPEGAGAESNAAAGGGC